MRILVCFNSEQITRRFSSLSSTIRTFASGATKVPTCFSSISFLGCHSPDFCFPASSRGNITVNLLPVPTSLCTSTFPSISRQSSLTIASPRPLPSIFLYFFTSTLVNASNNVFIASFSMPYPVSFTEKRIFSPHLSTWNTIEPFSVYFTALLIRFSIICFICKASPFIYSGSVSSIFT